jgi:hypothetical protein
MTRPPQRPRTAGADEIPAPAISEPTRTNIGEPGMLTAPSERNRDGAQPRAESHRLRVETATQHELLAAAGCDYAQGLLHSQPVPPSTVSSRIFRGQWSKNQCPAGEWQVPERI